MTKFPAEKQLDEGTLAGQSAANQIVEIAKKWEEFWPNSLGWATQEVVDQLGSAEMERHTSVATSLSYWPERLELHGTIGEYLLAWACLGSVVEGGLKVFFCVYTYDWQQDDDAPTSYENGGKRKQNKPSRTMLDSLLKYAKKRNIFEPHDLEMMALVRDQRNLIHPLKQGETLMGSEFNCALVAVASIYQSIDDRIPYPDY